MVDYVTQCDLYSRFHVLFHFFKVRDVMHKAFWDQLAEQLAQEPQCYEQALILLQEVRDNLLDITLPHHTRLRQEISDTLDVDLIKQQAEHGVLDFSQ